MKQDHTDNLPTVMVVEDNPSITRMLRFSLKEEGFGITEVSTGAAALGLLARDRPEAVVLDLSLSDGGAWLVLERLRRDTGHCPAWVCISSMDRQDTSNEHGPLGEHFLEKPFDPWVLVERLKAMLSEARTPIVS